MSIKKEQTRLSDELKKIQRGQTDPVSMNENALDNIYRTFITLNNMVKDDLETDTRTSQEKAAALTDKVQELVFSAIRSLTSEDAQWNFSLLLPQRKVYSDFSLKMVMLVAFDNRHPLKVKKVACKIFRKIFYRYIKTPFPPMQELTLQQFLHLTQVAQRDIQTPVDLHQLMNLTDPLRRQAQCSKMFHIS